MKKIVLAFVATLSVIAVQAASIAWGSGGGDATQSLSPNGGDLTSYTAYLCQGSVTDAQETASAIRNKTWTYSYLADIKELNSKGRIPSGTASLLKDLNAGNTYDFYVVTLDNSSIEGATYFRVSSVLEGIPYDEAAGVSGETIDWESEAAFYDVNGSMTDLADYTTNGWTKINDGSVPEPTVLALLALGVAGMALKRKVA